MGRVRLMPGERDVLALRVSEGGPERPVAELQATHLRGDVTSEAASVLDEHVAWLSTAPAPGERGCRAERGDPSRNRRVEAARRLTEIHDGKLWKSGTAGNGYKPYAGFRPFCRAEGKFNSEYAYMLMRLLRTFGEERLSEFGVGKLRAIVSLPSAEEREEQLRLGGTRKEITARVRRLQRQKQTHHRAAGA